MWLQLRWAVATKSRNIIPLNPAGLQSGFPGNLDYKKSSPTKKVPGSFSSPNHQPSIMRYLSTNIPLWSFFVPKKSTVVNSHPPAGGEQRSQHVTAYVTPQAAQAAPGTHIEAEALVPSHGRPEVQCLLQQGPSRGRRHAARSQQGGQRHATWDARWPSCELPVKTQGWKQ